MQHTCVQMHARADTSTHTYKTHKVYTADLVVWDPHIAHHDVRQRVAVVEARAAWLADDAVGQVIRRQGEVGDDLVVLGDGAMAAREETPAGLDG